ncbi:MAG: hypothetical protein AAGG07_04525 [Planctomycetota bacterium]
MDDRQSQIREGAGLEESRVNQEFVDFLKKAFWPVMIIVAVAVVSFRGFQMYEQAKEASLAQAFFDLDVTLASDTPSPEALAALADEHEGQGSVSSIARLEAADIARRAAITGVEPGLPTPGPDATDEERAEASVDETERGAYLDRADELYSRVWQDTESDAGQGLLAISAGYGLGAVSEARGAWDDAADRYDRVSELAALRGFDLQARIAKRRAEDIRGGARPPRIWQAAELPEDELVMGESDLPGRSDEEVEDASGPMLPDLPETPNAGEAPSEDAPADDAPAGETSPGGG